MAWEEIKLVYKPKGVQSLKPCGTLPSNKNPESFRITCLQLGHTQSFIPRPTLVASVLLVNFLQFGFTVPA